MILAHRWLLALLTLPLLAVAPPALADWVLPPGAAARLNGGTAALGCSDVINGGTITLAPDGAVVAVRNATTLTTGTLALDDGRLELAADWTSAGQVSASGGGQVLRAPSPGCPLVGLAGPVAWVEPVPAVAPWALVALMASLLAAGAARLRRAAARAAGATHNPSQPRSD